MRLSFIRCFIIILGVLSYALPARADLDSFEATLWRPAADSSPYLVLYESHIRPQGAYSFGLLMYYAEAPLKRSNFLNVANDPIHRHIMGHLLGSYSLVDFVNISLDFPLAIYNHFSDPASALEETEFSLGDLQFNIKLRAFDGRTHMMGLAFLPYIRMPTGNGFKFTGTNDFAGGITVISDRDFGKFFAGTNIGWQIRDRAIRGGLSVDDLLTYGFGFGGRLGWGLTPRLEIVGATEPSAFFAKETSPLEIDLSVEKIFSNGIEIDFGVGIGAVRAVGSPMIRMIAGLSFTEACFGQSRDDDDNDYTEIRRSPSDNYKPKSPDLDRPFQPAPRMDSDRDGLDDLEDQCPMVPGSYSNQGCPASPGAQMPPPEEEPLGDKGPPSQYAAKSRPMVNFSAHRIETPPLNFEAGKTELTPEIKDILDEVIAGLKARPNIQVIRIEGHTDASGDENSNIRLSKERALHVAQHIDAAAKDKLIEYVGWGPARPLYSNDTKAGREKNRRVEIHIIKTAEPTPNPTPAPNPGQPPYSGPY
ncbi:MAG: hypothetical protein A3F89_03725 [Deltaproteobacteria bacterium RIFCSPLOWO2_12_FULL_50_11]|nr:MAG: hypothetical protein A3F89_03725 [Deltaproteobacteria bacterium RIFCSPLOWO2_12_FULL_50_11]